MKDMQKHTKILKSNLILDQNNVLFLFYNFEFYQNYIVWIKGILIILQTQIMNKVYLNAKKLIFFF